MSGAKPQQQQQQHQRPLPTPPPIARVHAHTLAHPLRSGSAHSLLTTSSGRRRNSYHHASLGDVARRWGRDRASAWLRSDRGGRLPAVVVSQQLRLPASVPPGRFVLGIDAAAARAVGVPEALVEGLTRASGRFLRHCAAVTLQRCVRAWMGRERLRRMRAREEHRDNCAREILQTEIKYLEQLGVIIDLLLNPLLERGGAVLSAEEVRMIFSDVPVIAAVNKSLLVTLQERIARWSRMQKLGDVFVRMSDYLRVYRDYVKGYAQAVSHLNGLPESHPWRTFFQEQLRKAPASYRGFNIESLLIVPIQRIPRYKLLLDDLLKHTDPDHPDYADLSEACKKIASIAEWVNENQRKSEQMEKVVQLQRRVVGMEEGLVAASRVFIADGDVVQVIVSGKKLRRRFLILFNDLIVLCEPKTEGSLFSRKTQTKLQFQLKIRTEDAALEDLPDTATDLNGFRIRYNGRSECVTLCTQTAEEKAKWLKDIGGAISAAVEQAREKDEQKLKVASARAEAAAAILSQQYATLRYTGQPLSRALSEVSSTSPTPESGAPASPSPTAAAAADGSQTGQLPPETAESTAQSTSTTTSRRFSTGPGSPGSMSLRRQQPTFFSMNAMDKWRVVEEAKEELDRLKSLSRIAEMMQNQRATETAERSKALLSQRYSAMVAASSVLPTSLPSEDPAMAAAAAVGDAAQRNRDMRARTVTAMHVPQRFTFGRRVADDPLALNPSASSGGGMGASGIAASASGASQHHHRPSDFSVPGSRVSLGFRATPVYRPTSPLSSSDDDEKDESPSASGPPLSVAVQAADTNPALEGLLAQSEAASAQTPEPTQAP